MYPIQNFLKYCFCLFTTYAFAFVLTFSHVLIYNSLEHDFSTNGSSIQKVEKSVLPADEEQDEAPEHLNTIFLTDFLTYRTYSLEIHSIDIKESVFISNQSIYSDSFFSDILRPPIFA